MSRSNHILRRFIRESLRHDSMTEVVTAFDIVRLFMPTTQKSEPDVSIPKIDLRRSFNTGGGLGALIVGDSQVNAQLGLAFKTEIESLGFSVTLDGKTSASSAVIASVVERSAQGRDLVVAICGGNDASPDAASESFRRMCAAAESAGCILIVIGPPPATRITDLALARNVFGPEVGDNENYHLERDGGMYPDQRVRIADSIEDAAERFGDRTRCVGYGIAVHFEPGVDYPDQPDGIHCNVGAGEIVRKILDEINFDDMIRDLTRPEQVAIDDGDLRTDVPENTIVHGVRLDKIKNLFVYDQHFIDAADATGLSPAFVKAIGIAESRLNPNAVSPVGAQGLMQFMPGTAKDMGLVDPFEPVSAIHAGAKYLRQQFDRFGSLELAAAAYNAGPGAVKKSGGIPKNGETDLYVPKVMDIYRYLSK